MHPPPLQRFTDWLLLGCEDYHPALAVFFWYSVFPAWQNTNITCVLRSTPLSLRRANRVPPFRFLQPCKPDGQSDKILLGHHHDAAADADSAFALGVIAICIIFMAKQPFRLQSPSSFLLVILHHKFPSKVMVCGC